MKPGQREEGSIRFRATLRAAGEHRILRLPDAASGKLPSRGQVAVRGTIDGHPFATVIEPDGEFGHWLRVGPALPGSAARLGEEVDVTIQPTDAWPEPGVPPDLRRALSNGPSDVQDLWSAITPMARWEWVRWVNATRNPATRARRVEASISKLHGGKRRPCCFNLASCTDPELARNGKLVVEGDRG